MFRLALAAAARWDATVQASGRQQSKARIRPKPSTLCAFSKENYPPEQNQAPHHGGALLNPLLELSKDGASTSALDLNLTALSSATTSELLR